MPDLTEKENIPKNDGVFLFEFGDQWIFQINKTRHKDKLVKPEIVYLRVIEAKGKNPKQYPNWEYEEK